MVAIIFSPTVVSVPFIKLETKRAHTDLKIQRIDKIH